MWQISYGGEWWAMATTICMEPRGYWQQPWTKYLLKAKNLEIKCICVKNRKTNTSASYILSSDLLITFSSLSFSVHPTPNFGVRDHSPLAASFGEQSSSFFHFLYFSALFFLFDYVLFFFSLCSFFLFLLCFFITFPHFFVSFLSASYFVLFSFFFLLFIFISSSHFCYFLLS